MIRLIDQTFTQAWWDLSIACFADVIRRRQLIFKDLLDVPGLQRFVERCDNQAAGKEVKRALKHLKSDPNACK